MKNQSESHLKWGVKFKYHLQQQNFCHISEDESDFLHPFTLNFGFIFRNHDTSDG